MGNFVAHSVRILFREAQAQTQAVEERNAHTKNAQTHKMHKYIQNLILMHENWFGSEKLGT